MKVSRSLLSTLAMGVLSLGTCALIGAPSAVATTPAALQLTLAPNHMIAAKTGAGHGHGGGGGGGGGGGTSCGSNTALGWASSNWSGYAETCKAPYTEVSGNWNVPSVSGPNGSYSAAWVGIDGYTNSSLIQTGTEQDVSSSGQASYAAWWTTSAQNFAEQPITTGCSGSGTCGQVSAGDAIAATITQAGAGSTSWTIVLSDTSAGWSFTKTLTYTGPGASAEWVLEAPTVGGQVATLANFASANTPLVFDLGTVNAGVSPDLFYSDGGQMVAGHGRFVQVVSTPSMPDGDVSPDGFAIAYGAVTPAAPVS